MHCEISSLESLHWLDRLLQNYEEEIKTEVRLVNEVAYPISRSFSISTGLSTARSFIPVVKITHRANCVSFTREGWEEFIIIETVLKSMM